LHCGSGGAVCSQTFPSFVGLSNAADALAAIRQAVFEEGRVTLAALAEACRNNFAGAEELRRYLRTACPRYGNDDARADALAVRIYNRVAARLSQARNVFGQAYAPQYFGWLTHGTRGGTTAATPDGRHAGDAVAGTLGGDGGGDTHGPTALLRSVTALDHTLASGGVAVNLALSPAAVRTEADIDAALDLLLAYFRLGGMQLQCNFVDPATLRDAQAHPEAHAHLLVRVAGYADRFVALEKNVQDEIISRTQHGV
jgi:formate C-acetyltransferase